MTSHWRWGPVALVLMALALAGAAVAMPASAKASAQWSPAAPYSAPIGPMRVLELARIPPEPWLAGHRGVDLATEVGAPVVSPSAGVVAFVGWVVDRGVVTVQHADGGLTSLEPVDASVARGDRVERGEALGTVSDSPGHCAPATCVHWGIRVDGDYIDPLDALDGYGRVRLLPRAAGSFRRRPPYA